MRKSVRKSIKVYFTDKIKKKAIPAAATSVAAATATISTAAERLVSSCRRPRTSSFSLNVNGPLTSFKHTNARAATLSDVERFVFENFNSLYVQDDHRSSPNEQPKYVDPPPPSSPPFDDTPPSKHYFVFSDTVGKPKAKNEHRRSKCEEESSSDLDQTAATEDSVAAVKMLSSDPYTDFRRSMEEVMVARQGCALCRPVDWDFMEELLLCYLDMNDRSVHKYVLEAFSDLAVSARRRRPTAVSGGRRRKKVREVVDV